jgi:hypothetical protein
MSRIMIVIALSGCTVAQAKANITEMCVSYPGVMIHGVTPGTTTVDHVWMDSNLSAIQSLASLVSDLQFVRVDATAVSGISDFTFVQAAHVTIASGDPSSTLPTLDVYDCDGDCDPTGDTLSVPSTLQQSAIDYVESGSVVLDFQMVGEPPTNDWTMDIDVCFRGELGYQATL